VSERWAPILGWAEYEVSTEGRVRSVRSGRLLTPNTIGLVTLSVAARRRKVNAGNLVMEAFVGPCPPGHQLLRANSDRRDCRLSNVRWAPISEARAPVARRTPKKLKLPPAAVESIRSRVGQGETISSAVAFE
jgi:hypothetical protein